MEIKSSSFDENIPTKYSCDGEKMSPALEFSEVPENTKSLVLIMEDPDVPKEFREDGMWNHWVVFNISPTTTSVKEGEAPQGVMGITTSETKEYVPPCPPPGTSHRYFFKLFALDTELELSEGATKEQVLAAIEGHVIEKAEFMKTYTRPGAK